MGGKGSRRHQTMHRENKRTQLSASPTNKYTHNRRLSDRPENHSKMRFRAVKLCKPCLNKKYPLRKQLLLSFLTLAAVSDPT